MIRYRFTRDDFSLIFDELNEKGECDLAEVFMRVGNMIIENWESKSQKLFGFADAESGKVSVWMPKGKVKGNDLIKNVDFLTQFDWKDIKAREALGEE